jgi:hypothetical protein
MAGLFKHPRPPRPYRRAMFVREGDDDMKTGASVSAELSAGDGRAWTAGVWKPCGCWPPSVTHPTADWVSAEPDTAAVSRCASGTAAMPHADPPRRLRSTRLLVADDLLGWGVLGGLVRRGVDLVGNGRGQSPVAVADPDVDRGTLAEQVGDALGLGGGLVVHATGAHRAALQGATVPVAGRIAFGLVAAAREAFPRGLGIRAQRRVDVAPLSPADRGRGRAARGLLRSL